MVILALPTTPRHLLVFWSKQQEEWLAHSAALAICAQSRQVPDGVEASQYLPDEPVQLQAASCSTWPPPTSLQPEQTPKFLVVATPSMLIVVLPVPQVPAQVNGAQQPGLILVLGLFKPLSQQHSQESAAFWHWLSWQAKPLAQTFWSRPQ